MAESYLPSASTGVFGSYILSSSSSPEAEEKTTSPTPSVTPYRYLPSVNSGVFGCYTVSQTSYSSPDVVELDYTKLPPYLEISKTWSPGQGHSSPSSNSPAPPPESRNVTVLAEFLYPSSSSSSKNSKNSKCKFYVCQGSVVDFSGEALVNAANEGCLGGGGVDGAISSAGGRKLDELRRKLPILRGGYTRCPTGSAVVTGSGFGTRGCRLKSKYVIHAVGPNYSSLGFGGGSKKDVKKCDNALYNAYATCLKLGAKYQMRQIGFCLLSAGIFRGSQSLEKLIEIGVQALFDNVYDGCEEIYIIGFRRNEIDALMRVTPRVFGKASFVYGTQSRAQSGGKGGGKAVTTGAPGKKTGKGGKGKTATDSKKSSALVGFFNRKKK